ncbi:MAG TPA: GntR family transcriptional regulator [Gemmataceae bacterium]|nr:GntR family transcriptional regulator [Gemmataceae bacterium]
MRTSTEAGRGHRRAALVASLLGDVFSGRVRAGEHLVTQDVAARFGVSHTPVREALIALAGMGIIDLQPNRGAVVRRVSRQEVREVCQVRRVLECEATRLACGQIALSELDALADAFGRMKARRSLGPELIDEARTLDTRLHDAIAESCGNAFLAKEIGRLKMLFRAFRDVAWEHDDAKNDYRRLAQEAGEHLAIVEALRAGDAKQARRAMANHIRSGIKYWSRALPVRPSEVNGHATNNGKTKRSRR